MKKKSRETSTKSEQAPPVKPGKKPAPSSPEPAVQDWESEGGAVPGVERAETPPYPVRQKPLRGNADRRS